MTRPIPDYLRIYNEQQQQPSNPARFTPARLPDLFAAFEHATGWSLRVAPGPVSVDEPDLLWAAPLANSGSLEPRHLRIDFGGAVLAAEGPHVELDRAIELASGIANVLNDLASLECALRRAEAELALEIPVVAEQPSEADWARKLEAVLKSGAEAIGANAAALYLLDDGTKELKQRASWGLPVRTLAAPARELKAAKADLEALCGHAVAIERDAAASGWNVPEKFEAALCLPVCGQGEPLGTIWFFTNAPRKHSDTEVSLAELVSGRLASELEREVLARDTRSRAAVDGQLQLAARRRRQRAPRGTSLAPEWDLAVWVRDADSVNGAFYDWFLSPDDQLWFVAGHCHGADLQSAMCAESLQAALRAHGDYAELPCAWFQKANRTMWMTSAGDQAASLAGGLLGAKGAVQWTLAGASFTWTCSAHSSDLLLSAGPCLGAQIDWPCRAHSSRLSVGDFLVAATFDRNATPSAIPAPNASFGAASTAAALLEEVRRQWSGETAAVTMPVPQTIAVIRYRG